MFRRRCHAVRRLRRRVDEQFRLEDPAKSRDVVFRRCVEVRLRDVVYCSVDPRVVL